MENKEIISTFTWNNSKYAENNYVESVINGRTYLKLGKLQKVTFGGLLYKVNAPSEESINRYMLLVGVSKQNPIDRKHSKEIGEETAMTNAFTAPIMKLMLPSAIDTKGFANIVKSIYINAYHDNLKMVKTKEEIEMMEN